MEDAGYDGSGTEKTPYRGTKYQYNPVVIPAITAVP